jgi:GNAT superfamily N-acetyltransferase
LSDFTIKAATEADVPLVLRLIKALAAYEKLAEAVVATEQGLRDALFGERRYAEVVIGCAGREPAGFALYFHNFSTFRGAPGVYLEDLYVEPQWRGQGLGRLLLAHVARVAVERGCHRVEWMVLDWNDPAIHFYRRLGARAMDDWTLYRLAGEELHRLAGTPSPAITQPS